MKRARFIYNPKSGREQISGNLAELLAVYEDVGYETSAFRTTAEPLSAQHEATRVAKAGYELIIAAGGDGTINEVVNGISNLEYRPDVAIIPGGTSNDYAHALGVPRTNLIRAARVIEKNNLVPMDIGQLSKEDGDQYFINIAAVGKLAELTFEVSPELKSTFGYLAYLAKGAERLPQVTAIPMKITFDDDEVFEEKASLIFIALTNTFGGFDAVAPDKVPGDGNFTVIVVKTANFIEIGNLLMKLINGGQHVGDSKIIYRKANEVKLETQEEKLSINLDGDFGGHLPATFKTLKRHINFFGDYEKMTNSINPRDEETKVLKDKFITRVKMYDLENNDEE